MFHMIFIGKLPIRLIDVSALDAKCTSVPFHNPIKSTSAP